MRERRNVDRLARARSPRGCGELLLPGGRSIGELRAQRRRGRRCRCQARSRFPARSRAGSRQSNRAGPKLSNTPVAAGQAVPLGLAPTASLAREQGVNVLIDLVPEQISWVFSGIVVRRGDVPAAATC